MMKPGTFRKRLAVYGADFSRWEEKEAAAARALLERSPEARALLAREQSTERMLDALPAPEADTGFAARTADNALRQAASKPARRDRQPLFPGFAVPAGALALAAVLLFALAWDGKTGNRGIEIAYAEVNDFLGELDRLANRTEKDIAETESLIALLEPESAAVEEFLGEVEEELPPPDAWDYFMEPG